MPIHSYRGVTPQVGEDVFLAPTAWVIGEVTLGADVSFWFHTVARGDVNWIEVGDRSNIQDGTILHVTHERHPLAIGADVVVGHGAIVHGCTVEDRALIGIGARVLDGAVVEEAAQIGAGAVVVPGQRIPARTLALGVPARIVRPLTPQEVEANGEIARRYVRLKNEYLRGFERRDAEAGTMS